MESPSEFPKIPESGGRNQTLEATASMMWTLLFLAYSSKTFTTEFGQGWDASWTVLLIMLPVTLAGLPAVLDKRQGAFRILFTYLLYILLPSIIQLCIHKDTLPFWSHLSDFITVAIIWLPLELRMLSNDLSATGKVTVWGLLTAALNIVNIFTVLRPFSEIPNASGLGFSFKFTLYDVPVAIAMAPVYAITAIALATITRFARFKKPAGLKPERELAAFVGIYMSALTEELLFRGLIQNMLEQRLGHNAVSALLISALAYGVAHLRKTKNGYGPPNLRFALIAVVCGTTSGLVWRWTEKVTASAISHAVGHFVLWRVFLQKPNES